MGYKQLTAFMLSAFLLFGCTGPNTETTEVTEASLTEPTVATTIEETTEPPIPDDGRIRMYYDDRLPIAQLADTDSSDVQILTEEITSFVPGTQTADSDILVHDPAKNQLIAVGVGTATVTVAGQDYQIRVLPAPISLIMITGHSIGAGQCGTPSQSALCPEGQVYSSVLSDNIGFPTAGTGIGYASTQKPNGIDAMTASGAGVQGEGAGLALEWNRLTGEKVWVLNAAVGGSCLNEWVEGSEFFSNASALYMKAQITLMQEIEAGHYRLKNRAIVYHSAANFGYKKVTYNNQLLETWYHSMVNGFMSTLPMDLTGDGKPDAPQAIGFVPLPGDHSLDRPANYYMAHTDRYPDLFMASMISYDWKSNPVVSQTFPPIDYETHGEPVTQPVMQSELKAEDGVHYTQVAYNALGQDIAKNLYAYFRQKPVCESVTVQTEYGIDVEDTLKISQLHTSTPLILQCEPCTVSDLTITVSDNLTIGYPFVISATEAGEGTIVISQGDQVLKTITVTIG